MKRNKLNKIFSLFLVLMMFVSIIPGNVIKAEEQGKTTMIIVKDMTVKGGETFTVDIEVKDNPGILGAMLKVEYDSNLTLKGVESGDAFSHLVMTKAGKMQSPYQVVWDGIEMDAEDIKDGAILHMTFSVSDNVEPGEVLGFSVSSDNNAFIDSNLNPIEFEIECGDITVSDLTPGDINDDGSINSLDVIIFINF